MEHQHEKDQMLTLATRKCLFHLLSFLDSRLPHCSAIYSFVHETLITADSSFRVYFRQQRRLAMCNEDDYTLIIGVKLEHLVDSDQQLKKFWNLISWTSLDDVTQEREMAIGFGQLDMIDWKLDLSVMRSKHHTPLPAIMNFLFEKQGPRMHNRQSIPYNTIIPCNQYYLTKKDALDIKIRETDGVYVTSLERCHAQTVYDHWPYRESTTAENISKEIDLLPSAGVFLKENDQLVSWMMCYTSNGMSRLHTLEGHRRKGYAALVTQYLSKRVAQCGLIPFVNIAIENDGSHKLFESLGFKLLCPVHVMYFISR